MKVECYGLGGPACGEKATHYVQVIWTSESEGVTDYFDGYACPKHAEKAPQVGAKLERDRVVVEVDKRRLPR